MMEPLGKVASHSPKNSLGALQVGDAQQSGRSSSSLHAERFAASLHEPEATSPSRMPPNVLEKRTSDGSQGSANSSLSFTTPSPPTERRLSTQSHQPYVQPPLNPDTSSESSNGIVEADGQKRTSDGSDASVKRPKTAVATSRGRPSLAPVLHGSKNRSTPNLAGHNGYQAGTPLTMRDLGNDYTRYFSPYSNSARNSFAEKSTTSLPRPAATPRGAAAAALLAPKSANPFLTPNASTTKLNTDYDAEKNGSLIDDRLAAPYEEKGNLAWPLFGDTPEEDDDLHMPQPDDDIRYKAKFSDHFSRANLSSTIGLALMIIGLICVFIALPILSYAGIIDYNSMYGTPLDQMPKLYPDPEAWATVNDRIYPYLQNIRTGLIDPDTPQSAMTKTGEHGDEYTLVFSDEFNDNNRTFYEGDDPFWFAPDIWYGATQDLEWYDPDAVTTWEGTLELRLDKFPNHGLQFRSGMLNSWNHLCFKGGIFEVSMSLPGPAAIMGLWPGAWTMGNLGRPGYLSTTDGMWPYTYQACDVGITPNQSSYDGMSRLPGQRLSSCTCKGEDHPTPGTGRGAPEIDIVEAGASYPPASLPIATQSYQVAPFDIWWYPDYNFTAFPDYSLSYTNGYTGGPYQQAISATTNLNKDWYDGKQYQRYSFEYVPGEGEDSYIVWKVGGQTMFMIDGRAIGPNGNIQARQISEEPMSLILNLGISNSWTFIDWDHLVFPTVMRVDYVRWYQKTGEEMVTCDPPGFETTSYIKEHPKAYNNPNYTHWEETGYSWPKHKLNTDC